MTRLTAFIPHKRFPLDGDAISLPAVIGHSRPTGYTTVLPRGDFDRDLKRDCEADGVTHFMPREVA